MLSSCGCGAVARHWSALRDGLMGPYECLRLRVPRWLPRWSVGTGSPWLLKPALRAAPPVDDLGLVDLIAHLVDRGEAGCGTDRAVDVGRAAADAADHVVVIVADPGLEAGRRPG